MSPLVAAVRLDWRQALIVAVHMKHSVLFHGSQEEWDTVYHYSTPTITTDAGWLDLANAIKAAEQPLYGADVTFKQVRIHGPTDHVNADGTKNKADDQMIAVLDLSGAGTSTSGQTIPPEMAVVLEWYLGRSNKGYKQILKKFFHGVTIAGTSPTTGMAFGRDALLADNKTKFITAGNNLKTISISAGSNNIVNSWGKGLPTGTAPTVKDYVVTRQFRRRGK